MPSPYMTPEINPSDGPPLPRPPHSGPPPDAFADQVKPSLQPSEGLLKLLSWGLFIASLATIALTVIWNIEGGRNCSAMRPCPSQGNALFWKTLGWTSGAVLGLTALGYVMQALAYVGDIRDYRKRFKVWDADQKAQQAKALRSKAEAEANRKAYEERRQRYYTERDADKIAWDAERARVAEWREKQADIKARLHRVEKWFGDGLRAYFAEHDFLGETPQDVLVLGYSKQVRRELPTALPDDYPYIRYTKNAYIAGIIKLAGDVGWIPHPPPPEPYPDTPLMDAYSALSEEERKQQMQQRLSLLKPP